MVPITQIMLQLTDVFNNNNKYYKMTLYDNGNVLSEYGRVGAQPQTRVYQGGQQRFDVLLAEKQRKGYRIVQPPSVEVADGVSVDNAQPEVSDFLRTIYRASGKKIKSWYDGDIGKLSKEQIEMGRRTLRVVQNTVSSSYGTAPYRLKTLLGEYYSTIPHVLPRDIRSIADEWNMEKVAQEWDYLQDLEDALRAHVSVSSRMSIEDAKKSLGIKIFTASDEIKARWAWEIKRSESSVHRVHLTLVNLFEISNKYAERYESCTIDNERMLYHGSKTPNFVGLLSRGFLIKPPGVPTVGSMFGNGIYFADQSTKSTQYCSGGNIGGDNSWPSYLIIARVKLGDIKRYQRAQSSLNKPPHPYHSVMGEAGPSLHHNEYIVYDQAQTDIAFVAEVNISRR